MGELLATKNVQATASPRYSPIAPPPSFPLGVVRHGQHENADRYRGVSNDPLSPEGRHQGQQIGHYLVRTFTSFYGDAIRGGGSLEVYTSPQPRAMQTAEIATSVMASQLGLPVKIIVDGRLKEFDSPPPIQDMTVSELNGKYRGNPMRAGLDMFGGKYFTEMGAETPEQIAARTKSFLDELRAKSLSNGHNRLPRLAFSHGGVLQFMLYQGGIELIDKDDSNHPYTKRGDGFIYLPDGSIRMARIQDNSKTL